MSSEKGTITSIDGSKAASEMACLLSESMYIYPITPSSVMAEYASDYANAGKTNIFDQKSGSAGALHGAATSGILTTTFTSSQGLLLMLPNMYKLSGELLPCVIHVAARTIANVALSIFGDHSDIYATRECGFAYLGSATVQETAHMALAAHVITLKSSIPFVHFQDGFRTTHEISKINFPSREQIKEVYDFEALKKFRERGLNPRHPVLRGSSQAGDVYFQAVEANNVYYNALPGITIEVLNKINSVFGTNYKMYEYYGVSNAEHIIIVMGSAAVIVKEVVEDLNKQGKRYGMVLIRLYRPFVQKEFINVIPKTAKKVTVLDRSKDALAGGEPLYTDVCTALLNSPLNNVEVYGGRYGLSSLDFTPRDVMKVFMNMEEHSPKKRFTVGIKDDVCQLSLDYDIEYHVLDEGVTNCLLLGIGGDGTVGANKTAISIIGNNTDNHAEGYFEYDANKSGGLTISHLLAHYLAVHTTAYIYRFDVGKYLHTNGIFVLNCPWKTVEELTEKIPNRLKRALAVQNSNFYVINASEIAERVGLHSYINMVLQAVFFKLSGVLEESVAVELLKNSIKKMYGHKGDKVINMNIAAVDEAIAEKKKKEFIDCVYNPLHCHEGPTKVSVSNIPPAGEVPTGTSKYSKRGTAFKVPHWDHTTCVQCNKCSFTCPHSVIRPFFINEEEMKKAPNEMVTLDSKKVKGMKFRIQCSDQDCTGCSLCAEVCPVQCLHMTERQAEFEEQKQNIEFLQSNVENKPEASVDKNTFVGVGPMQNYLEFPGACPGCGETPYLRLVSQLYGRNMIVAAATGCNSVYSGSYPLVPFCTDKDGYGPAWHNSLFEDNAEFGFGMATAYRHERSNITEVVKKIVDSNCDEELCGILKRWLDVKDDVEQSHAIEKELRNYKLSHKDIKCEEAKTILEEENLKYIGKAVHWMFGGDGWAYDIGYGGLDHVLASGEDVNILVLDTEVYSNTGGHASKATPFGASAKFASTGKKTIKKDLGMIAMTYENVFVASIAIHANQSQAIKAIQEAVNYHGPSIVICNCPCIEHHYAKGMQDVVNCQKLAVDTGCWLLYRYNPDLKTQHKNPFKLESAKPKKPVEDYLNTQTRFTSLGLKDKEFATETFKKIQQDVTYRYKKYEQLGTFFQSLASDE
ncbi:Pyruvate:ferredoxin oxidoreductase [Entamoeba marina]